MLNNKPKARFFFVIGFLIFMIVALILSFSPNNGVVRNGVAVISGEKAGGQKTVFLDGTWEFYWNRLLGPEVFTAKGSVPEPDAFIKVPGSWKSSLAGKTAFPDRGVATYRVNVTLPVTISDPAIKIRKVMRSYKLFVNGNLLAEAGTVSGDKVQYRPGYQYQIVDLPRSGGNVELILQTADLDYAYGGLRESPVIGSRKALEEQTSFLMILQLILFGGVLIFSIYYFIFYIMQRSNKLALLFSFLCLLTAMRTLIWGEMPLMALFPFLPVNVSTYLNFISGYNLVPLIILIVLNIDPEASTARMQKVFLLPTLGVDALLFTSVWILSKCNDIFYLMMMFQMGYVIFILCRMVLRGRPNAILLLFAVETMIITILFDIITNKGVGNHFLPYLSLICTFVIILVISIVQAVMQAEIKRQLTMYNENLLESNRLKDKILATEMMFLQAQIKPHFLYNSLNAIANVCEKDSEMAGKLILDMAVYLQNSLEFNHLDKMSTIAREMEFVSTYFHIEKARFGDKIRIRQNLAVSQDFPIPVLMIQPIVENAVRHGISKKVGGGTVTVSVTAFERGVEVQIEDDGVGMDPQKAARILNDEIVGSPGNGKSGIPVDGERRETGVGLQNIHHRLLRLYGEGLSIWSENGTGTIVKFVVPEYRMG